MKYSYGTTLLGEIQSRIKLRPAAVEVVAQVDEELEIGEVVDDEGMEEEVVNGAIEEVGLGVEVQIPEELLEVMEDEGIIELLLGLVEEVVRVALDEEAMDEQGTVTVIVE